MVAQTTGQKTESREARTQTQTRTHTHTHTQVLHAGKLVNWMW